MTNLKAQSIRENNEHAFAQAEKLGISRVLSPDDMVASAGPDRLAVMTYLHQLYHYFVESGEAQPESLASKALRSSVAGAHAASDSPSGSPSRSPSSSAAVLTSPALALAPAPAALRVEAVLSASQSHQSVLGDDDWILAPDSLPPMPSSDTIAARLSNVCLCLLLPTLLACYVPARPLCNSRDSPDSTLSQLHFINHHSEMIFSTVLVSVCFSFFSF